MQRLAPQFQEYLRRFYAIPAQQTTSTVVDAPQNSVGEGQTYPERDTDENGPRAAGGTLKIVIDWGALDVDRKKQTIFGGRASDLILKLLAELIGAFGKPMEQQLTELPVIRFPLSRNPATTFLNGATGKPFSYIQVPGTDLYFCPQSGNSEKVTKLTTLFSRLLLPDGRDFPEGSVQCSIEE